MNRQYIKSKKIYTENGIKDGILEVENGKFKKLVDDEKSIEGKIINYGENRIIPGIIDVHNHGFFGWSMMGDIGKEDVKGYLRALPYSGVTGIFPTAMGNAIKTAAECMGENYEGARILGIHSEGPFMNRTGEGGTENEFPKPTVEAAEKIWEQSLGKLRYMSFAPEVEGAYEVADFLRSKGVVVAAAHTNATASQMFDAVKHGFKVATHTGNVMKGIHHREVGALGAALLDPDMYCELIADFIHICPDMIRIMFKVKEYEKFLLISDDTPLAGFKPGKYNALGMELTIEEDGRVHTDKGRLLGSSKYVLYGIGNLVKKLGIPLEKAVIMSSLVPARVFNLDDKKGSIKAGKDADFVIIDDNYNALATYVEGKLAYSINDNNDLLNHEFLKSQGQQQ